MDDTHRIVMALLHIRRAIGYLGMTIALVGLALVITLGTIALQLGG